MFIANPHAVRGAYPEHLRAIMNIDRADESRAWLSNWPMLSRRATPLWSLPALARALGVARIEVKDESHRSPLGSFKALGAPVALLRLILRERAGLGADLAALFRGRHARQLGDFTVISATDGNHGRALAAAARDIGCRCVIVLHRHVNAEREQAIAACGADIVRADGNYDDAVALAARLAADNGWRVVSDTSYAGYETVPRDVMQGYATIAAELAEQQDQAPTHVWLQGGVGGLAAGIVSHLWQRHGAARPGVIVVEPEQADCLFQSARQGCPARATGSVDSVMAGLACGETSPLAWRFLAPGVDFFQTIADADAVDAMRCLADPDGGDVPIVGGESGVAGLAGLIGLAAQPERRRQTGLDAGARVLLINTEGATAPSLYRQLTGASAASVLARQTAWLAAGG